MGVDRLSTEDFELFSICLSLVWYIQNTIMMDEMKGGSNSVASFCFPWAEDYLTRF